ncbi:MAG: HEAT repeat domain-containing protein [bacterium]
MFKQRLNKGIACLMVLGLLAGIGWGEPKRTLTEGIKGTQAREVQAIEIKRMIKELSEEEAPHIKARIIEDLGDLKAKEAVSEIIKALQDKEWTAKWKACDALGKIGDKKAVSALIERLEDKKESWSIRQKSAQALANIGAPETFNALIKALQYECEIERKREDMYPPPRHDYPPPDEYVEREFAEVLKNFIEASEKKDVYISSLIKYMNDKSLNNIFRYRLSLLLAGEWKIKDSIPVLIETLRNAPFPRGELRAASAYLLGELGAKEAIPYLKEALKDNYLTSGRLVSEDLGKEMKKHIYERTPDGKTIFSARIIKKERWRNAEGRVVYREYSYNVRNAAGSALQKLGVKVERKGNEYRVVE